MHAVARITRIGAKLTSSSFMVVVQQKSRGARYWSGGPKGATVGGLEVEFVYGFGTTQRSSDQTRMCMAIVLIGR